MCPLDLLATLFAQFIIVVKLHTESADLSVINKYKDIIKDINQIVKYDYCQCPSTYYKQSSLTYTLYIINPIVSLESPLTKCTY